MGFGVFGASTLEFDTMAITGGTSSPTGAYSFRASRVWGEHTGVEFAPVHIWQPCIVTNKRLQFSSLSCLGQPQWGGVRSGTYLATLHHLSRQFCMTFNLHTRLSEGGRGEAVQRVQRRRTRSATSPVSWAKQSTRSFLMALFILGVQPERVAIQREAILLVSPSSTPPV